MYVVEQDPYWFIPNNDGTQVLAYGRTLCVFSTKEKAKRFATACELNAPPNDAVWRTIVRRYGIAFDSVVIDPEPFYPGVDVSKKVPLVDANPPHFVANNYCRPENEAPCAHNLKMCGEICCCKDVETVAALQEVRGTVGQDKGCPGWAVRATLQRM